MWQRREIKRRARSAVKKNYIGVVIVCVVLAVFAGAYPTSFLPSQQVYVGGTRIPETNVQVVNDIIHTFIGERPLPELTFGQTATRGVLANLFNNATSSGSFLFGILNAINHGFFHNRVGSSIIILVGAVLSFLYWMFVGNILRIGECRFFIENASYSGTVPNRVLFLYKTRKTGRAARIMLKRTVFTILWSFTIVGGVIKGYSYRMVPYIIAENPDVTSKEAFVLSQRMMDGNKWRAFLLDMSFLPWQLLSAFTMGLLDFLYVNPYSTAANAELYLELRQRVLDKKYPYYECLNDTALIPVEVAPKAVYPAHELKAQDATARHWLVQDYRRSYSLQDIVLLFFSFCLIGWIWEVSIELFGKGEFINRGTMHGPWLPLYGCGGILVLLLLKRWREKPIVTFFLVMLLCGVLEYFTGWMLEEIKGVRWWEYDGYFLNINGRVCLEGLLVFGLAGSLGIYFLAPMFAGLFDRIPHKIKNVICVALICFFAVDLVYSSIYPNMGERITYSMDEQTGHRVLIPENIVQRW